jgi:hypothetical protein
MLEGNPHQAYSGGFFIYAENRHNKNQFYTSLEFFMTWQCHCVLNSSNKRKITTKQVDESPIIPHNSRPQALRACSSAG